MEPVKVMAGEEDVLITVTPLNKTGGPAKVEPGSTKADSSDQGVVLNGEVQGDDTGVEITLLAVSTGVAGATASLKVSADADLGEGVETIEVEVPVELVANPEDTKAVALGVVAAKGVPKQSQPSAGKKK